MTVSRRAIDKVIARLKPPKKSKSKQSSDTSGPLRSEKSATPEKLYHGEISGTGKRLYTADETLFLFEEFCKHHYKDPQKKDDVDAVRAMVQAGGVQSLSRMDQQECANHECYEERESGALQREDRAPSYFGMSASDLS